MRSLPKGRQHQLRAVGFALFVVASSACAPSLGGLAQDRQAAFIDTYLRQRQFNGAALVVHGGEIVLDEAYGFSDPSKRTRNTTDTVFAIGSITKTFTAAAVMRLVADGQLDLDQRAAELVPEFDFDPWRPITISQLLSHTSGLWRETGVREEVAPVTEVAERNRGIPIVCTPGTCFQYSNMGYEILGSLIERVTGRSYEEYLQDEFFTPLGLDSTGATVGPREVRNQAMGGVRVNGVLSPMLTAGEAAGAPGVSAGGIYSTTGDLYRWIEALREGRVLSPRTFREMVQPQSPTGPGPYDQYGYGWQVLRSAAVYWHTGGIFESFLSLLFVDERQDVVIIALSNDYSMAAELDARLIGFQNDARNRAIGLGWMLPLAAAAALIVSFLLLVRLVRQLRQRTRVVALPILRRFLVLVLAPSAIAYYAWQETVSELLSVGSMQIAFTIAPLWPRVLIGVAALYVLLVTIVAYGFTRSHVPDDPDAGAGGSIATPTGGL